MHGQKTFNGVAILSKFKFDEVTPRLPGDPADDHARFIEATVSTKAGALAGGVDLSAQRQPDRTPINIHIKSNGWSGFLNTHMSDFNWKSR